MDGPLLFSVFVFLSAACIFVPVSKLTGLGPVIGYLVAGVLIGPFALGLIDDPETILHFSEFGVVMMLFLIGLELRPAELWNMRGRLLGLGGGQVAITLALIALATYLAGVALGTAVAIGMSLALSSTAVGLRIMEDRGILIDPPGRAGFSVLLFQDVIVIAMIAAMPALAGLGVTEQLASLDATYFAAAGPSASDAAMPSPEGWGRVLAIFGVFGGMILGGRLLLRPALRFIARAEVREVFTAIALLLVIGAALLMDWLGLSAALGAFFGGVVLADSEYRHQLERDVEPFKSLLLGLFFMSVGMSLDFTALASSPALIIGGTVALMGLKFAVLATIGRVAGLDLADNLLFATLLCQAGEFGFVLFQFAQIEGVMDAETATVLSAVVALSMAATPLLLLLYDRIVAPRLRPPARTGDAPRDQHNPVLILGYGRVGQVAERLLTSQGIGCTLIDNDGDHIEFVRQFGNEVYYGDAADMDLLRLAGAQHAKVIIVAIDDIPKGNEAAAEIPHHFPDARVIARARGRNQLYELMAIGVDHAERETVRSSLAMGRRALEYLGMSERRAQALSERWLARDFELVERDYHLRGDLDALRQRADQNRALIRATLQADMEEMDAEMQAQDVKAKDTASQETPSAPQPAPRSAPDDGPRR